MSGNVQDYCADTSVKLGTLLNSTIQLNYCFWKVFLIYLKKLNTFYASYGYFTFLLLVFCNSFTRNTNFTCKLTVIFLMVNWLLTTNIKPPHNMHNKTYLQNSRR